MKKWILPVVIGILLTFGNIENVNAGTCKYGDAATGTINEHELTIYSNDDEHKKLWSSNGANTCGTVLICTKNNGIFTYWDDSSNFTATLSNQQYTALGEGYMCNHYTGAYESDGSDDVPSFEVGNSCDGYEADLVYVYTAWKNAAEESLNCNDPNVCSASNYNQYAKNYGSRTSELEGKITSLSNKYKNCSAAEAYFTKVKEEIIQKSEQVNQTKDYYTNASNSLSSEEQRKVDAANREYEFANSKVDSIQNLDFSNVLSCQEVLGSALKYVEMGFNIIQIAAPILLIVLGSVDLAGAVISNDNDALKKATSKLGKRAIAAVAIFFVPLLVKLLIGMTGLNIPDVACGLAYIYKGGIL